MRLAYYFLFNLLGLVLAWTDWRYRYIDLRVLGGVVMLRLLAQPWLFSWEVLVLNVFVFLFYFLTFYLFKVIFEAIVKKKGIEMWDIVGVPMLFLGAGDWVIHYIFGSSLIGIPLFLSAYVRGQKTVAFFVPYGLGTIFCLLAEVSNSLNMFRS